MSDNVRVRAEVTVNNIAYTVHVDVPREMWPDGSLADVSQAHEDAQWGQVAALLRERLAAEVMKDLDVTITEEATA